MGRKNDMKKDNTEPKDNERPVAELVHEISSGGLNPKLLDQSSKLRCVRFLRDKSQTSAQIAYFLKCSERTITRYREILLKEGELTPSMEFVKQTAGELHRIAMMQFDQLMRLSQEKDASRAESAQAIFFAWRIFKEYIEKLQTINYMPSRGVEVTGNIYHHDETEQSPERMQKAVNELEEKLKDSGKLDEAAIKRIEDLRKQVKQVEVVEEIKKLEQDTLKKEKDDEQQN